MLDSYKAIKSGTESTRASLVAQRLKRLPAMRETRVRFLGWEDPLKKEMATHCSIHSSHGWRSLEATVHRVAKSRTQLNDFTH